MWQVAGDTFRAPAAKPFKRFQFRLGLDHFSHVLEAAGLYPGELTEVSSSICGGMDGKGWVVFTWLEPQLFFVNTTNLFTSKLEVEIDLPAMGSRMPRRKSQLSDVIEMRRTSDGYELVFLTREQRYETSKASPLVLFTLPYKFFWALQSEHFAAYKEVEEILRGVGFRYQSDLDVSEAWSYRNEFGSFHWWNV